jgi:AcrR family transcriptional regulator
VEETTVAEIARAAKVTKGTFYFHFAHKEDILLELGWGTAEALYEEAIDGLASQIPAEKILDGLLVTLARRVGSVPKVAVARSVAQFLRQQRTERDRPHFGLRRAFIAVLAAGQKEGLLPESADVDEISVMTEVLAMDAVLGWAYGSEEPLVNVLRRRIDIVMEGARRSAAELPAMPSSGRRRTTGRSSATVRKSAS